MPNSAKVKTPDKTNPLSLPWKNSLLSKEEPEGLQNPVNFFMHVIKEHDNFSELFEDINSLREHGVALKYLYGDVWIDLMAFVVVRDIRGVNMICPINVAGEHTAQHALSPLRFASDKDEVFIEDGKVLGTISMMRDDYISACSRGFENASSLLLGAEAVELVDDIALVAAFYVFPLKGK